jgi:hypothetical protein
MNKSMILLPILTATVLLPSGVVWSSDAPSLEIIVNSNQDGVAQPDDVLTLREAIQIANGDRLFQDLSAAEKAQVLVDRQPLGAVNPSSGTFTNPRISFNLPPDQTTIRLTQELPPLAIAGLTLDGTTQPGYGEIASTQNSTLAAQLPNALTVTIPTPPKVAITSAASAEIFRGLTVVADRVTIRGLSLYGFTASHFRTEVTPPADIFISHYFSPPDLRRQPSATNLDSVNQTAQPPKDVVIENNWLGLAPAEDAATELSDPVTTTMSGDRRSAFGVSVFNGTNTLIRNNYIANHDGSGIITGVIAENLQITGNVLERNGFAGMPDAIRLEGKIQNGQIVGNLIQENAGSGIYLFKPEGAVQIRGNLIRQNSRRFRRAAIYLMGSDHEVHRNWILDQTGPGVVVAAYPNSDRNVIQNNQFTRLTGLSIDLVSQLNVNPQNFQQGDGENPVIDSHQRRRKTGNFGIDAPRFLSPEFFIRSVDGMVELSGVTVPHAVVEFYQVNEAGQIQGPLNQVIGSVKSDEKGNFTYNMGNLEPGARISAIATHPQYGTSEPAVNVLIRTSSRY